MRGIVRLLQSQSGNPDLTTRLYRCVPVSETAGFIEWVAGAKTLQGTEDDDGNVLNYLTSADRDSSTLALRKVSVGLMSD